MTIAESIEAFEPVVARAAEQGMWRRGYVSTAFGCPYTGAVEPDRAARVGRTLLDLGVDEVCYGDTIGVGVPSQVGDVLGANVAAGVPVARTAFHFHDTR